MMEMAMFERRKETVPTKRRPTKMDTAWENWIRAMEEPRRVTRNGVGFIKCVYFRRKN